VPEQQLEKAYLLSARWIRALNESESAEQDEMTPGQRLFTEANEEYDEGNFQAALDLFDRAIDTGAGNEVVWNNRGAALDALARHEEAADSYKKAALINPSYELAWHNLGNSLFIQELFEQAARAYSKAAKENPDRKENWSGLAASYSSAGMNKKARTAIEELDRFGEEDPLTLLLQADLYLEAGFAELSAARSKAFIAKQPAAEEGYARLGAAQHESGDYNHAIESFEQALKLSPADKEVWNNLGYTYFCAGHLTRAVECFDKALEIDPRYKNAWYNKGYAYHGADMLEDAVLCYEKALLEDSLDRVLWNNLGNALYNLGRYGESIPKFVEAIRVDPDYEIAWNNIGNALEKTGGYAEAIPFHERSLEINPEFDYALYAKGVCKAHTGDPEGGYDLVLESIALNPSYDEAWKARSAIATQMGRLDEALWSIEEALTLNPEFDQGWSQRGEILLSIGDAEGAHASFEMALRCLENVRLEVASGLTTLARRGDLLARLGRFDEALVNYETAALTGKNVPSVYKVIELSKFLERRDLPRGMKEVIERARIPDLDLAYASYLLDNGDVAEAERILERLTPDGEIDDTLVLARARARALAKDCAGAARTLQSEKNASVQSQLLRAEVSEEKGDLQRAARDYEAALDRSPSNVLAAIALARTRLRLGKYKAAIESSNLAMGIDPVNWEPHKIKSDAYAALKDNHKALEERRRAAELLAAAGLKPEDVWRQEK